MIRLIIRSGLLVCAVISMGIYAGIGSISFIGGVLFVCAWITIKDLKMIEWWILFYATIVSIGWHDQWGVHFIIMIVTAYVFNIVRMQLVRSNNDSIIWLLFVALSISFIADVLAKMISIQYFAYEPIVYLTTFFTSIFAFFIFVWCIRMAERFIELYAYDVQGHT